MPYLGLTNFHTKGEPREAIVAVSMLQNDNWISARQQRERHSLQAPLLPLVHRRPLAAHGRGDRVYLAAAVGSGLSSSCRPCASCSSPSAAATTWPSWRRCCCCRGSRYTGRPWPRGSTWCSPAFIVLALLQLYRWWEHHLRGIPVWAVLFMSIATLTKGPGGHHSAVRRHRSVPAAAKGIALAYHL